ncbi:hypothetical protein QTP70_025163 [Hemibagrus guttatus]|uniref:Uncharacterized protein n=1 Tax=Hemibagrus guttatus TaxID=175788 RepID=A0AAE0QNR8_9TELE|nr:hypothetical protein QTP70_025163 [Hemibagrus guttatus]
MFSNFIDSLKGFEPCYEASLGIKAGYTLDRVQTHRRAHTHSHSLTHYGKFRDANQPTVHVFGPEEENGVPGGNPRGEHANSTHTRWRWESNPQPWRCEANMLTTKPPCPPTYYTSYGYFDYLIEQPLFRLL